MNKEDLMENQKQFYPCMKKDKRKEQWKNERG